MQNSHHRTLLHQLCCGSGTVQSAASCSRPARENLCLAAAASRPSSSGSASSSGCSYSCQHSDSGTDMARATAQARCDSSRWGQTWSMAIQPAHKQRDAPLGSYIHALLALHEGCTQNFSRFFRCAVVHQHRPVMLQDCLVDADGNCCYLSICAVSVSIFCCLRLASRPLQLLLSVPLVHPPPSQPSFAMQRPVAKVSAIVRQAARYATHRAQHHCAHTAHGSP